MASVTVTTGGETASVSYTSALPWPTVKYSTLFRTGDTFHKAVSRLATISIVDLEGTTQTLTDMIDAKWDLSNGQNLGGYGLYVPNVGGIINGTVELVSGSSTWVSLVNALGSTGGNGICMFRLGPNNAVRTKAGVWSGTLVGTDQGHDFSGLTVYTTDKSVIGPGVIKGVPGSGEVPPYETTALSIYRSTNNLIQGVEIDGRNAFGVPVTASAFEYNYVSGSVETINGLYSHHTKYGSGVTHYMCDAKFIYSDPRFDSIAAASMNFEQCGGSTLTVDRPMFGTAKVDMILDSTNGHMNVTINDPIWSDGRSRIKICVHKTYSYGLPSAQPNQQINGTNNYVNVYVKGVLRNDLVQFVNTY